LLPPVARAPALPTSYQSQRINSGPCAAEIIQKRTSEEMKVQDGDD
jgi:hypothetical protein